MKRLPADFFENNKIFNNLYFRRISALLLVTIIVLSISHVHNIRYLQAQAQALHEKETRSKEIYIDGEYIGELRSEEVYSDILIRIRESLQHREGMDVKILNDIDLVDSHAEDEELTRKILFLMILEVNWNTKLWLME